MTRRLAAVPLRREDQYRRDNSWLVPGGVRHRDVSRPPWLESGEDGRPAVNVGDALAHVEREKSDTGGPQRHEQPDDHRDPLRAVHSVRMER